MDEEEIRLERIEMRKEQLWDAAKRHKYGAAFKILMDIKDELEELILLDQTRDT